jgi:hydroxymethylpyrimidine/phosphomethylpyrimidine kinase
LLSTGTPFDTPQPQSRKPPVVLTIAGFDPSSGAGITADLQVFAAHGLFGTACITALTVQSTQSVASVQPVSELIGPTLSHLDADLPPAGIKIGMVGSVAAVQAIVAYLRERKGPRIPVVLDPVFKSSSDKHLTGARGMLALQRELLPLVDWITPNTGELAALTLCKVTKPSEAAGALRRFARRHPHLHMVATGGHLEPPTDLLLQPNGEIVRFEGERVDTTSTHGTGCAFSSALLARLVLGDSPVAAVAAAKTYVTEALRRAPGLGHGRGPLNLLWPLAP